MLDRKINFEFKSKIKPSKGCLLISDPFMNDIYFQRSVVYICDHSSEGSFGFILNNKIKKASVKHPFLEGMPKSTFGIGGPINTDQLYVLHQFSDEITQSEKIVNGIYLGGEFADVQKHIINKSENHDKVLMFYGYSGWTPGQLDEEIETNSWVVSKDFTTEELFTADSTEFYNILMKRLGKKYELLAKAPYDPNLN